MKLKNLTMLTAALAASAVLFPAASQAQTPPPSTITETDTVTFGFSGGTGTSNLFDRVAATQTIGSAIYNLSSISVTWYTTSSTTSARIFNDSLTTPYTVTGLSGTNTFSLLTGPGGQVFSTDISSWTSGTLNTSVPVAASEDNPGARNTVSFAVANAGSAFTLTSANGSLFNWFVGTGETFFTLNNTNTIDSAITSSPPNTLGDLTANNRTSSQTAAGDMLITYTYSLSAVPEASSVVMGSFGLLGLAGAGFLRRRRASSPASADAETVEESSQTSAV
jgi:MYXO-CTERM domain-containing protein